MMPRLAKTDSEIMACFGVLQQLRPHLVEETFVSTVRQIDKVDFYLVIKVDKDRYTI